METLCKLLLKTIKEEMQKKLKEQKKTIRTITNYCFTTFIQFQPKNTKFQEVHSFLKRENNFESLFCSQTILFPGTIHVTGLSTNVCNTLTEVHGLTLRNA